MRKLLLILAVLCLSTTALAQQGLPVIVEVRATLSKASGDQAVNFQPTYAAIVDLGRIDLGMAYTGSNAQDTTQTIELYVPIELATWSWSEGKRILTLETYVGTDVAQGTTLKSRTVTLGAIYGSPVLKSMQVVARGQVVNYDWFKPDGTKTSLNDWILQLALRRNI